MLFHMFAKFLKKKITCATSFRELEKVRKALVTLDSSHTRLAVTLANQRVARLVERTDSIALAVCAT